MKLPSVTYLNRWAFFFATYFYVFVLYLATNHQKIFPAHRLPLTELDIHTPFWPWTGWIYISVYFLPLTVGFVVKTDSEVRRVISAFVLMTTACSIVFLVYPTTYPRPPLYAGAEGDLPLLFVRLVDTAKNCFPSQHVAFAFLSAFYVRHHKREWGNLAIVLAVLIAVSTLTTKQHYVWDVLVGYLIARITYWLSTGSWLPAPSTDAR